MNSRVKQNQRVGTGRTRRERRREGGNFIDFPTAAVLVVATATTIKSTAAPIFARLMLSALGTAASIDRAVRGTPGADLKLQRLVLTRSGERVEHAWSREQGGGGSWGREGWDWCDAN